MCTVPFHTGRIHVFEMNPGKIAENAIGGVRKRDSTGVIIRNKHFSLLLATNVKLIRVYLDFMWHSVGANTWR